MIKVFISYAWESPEFKQAIWNFAGWIEQAGNQQVKVISDHLFAYRPPEKGWPIWMTEQIVDSNVVLIICTPLYLERFTKSDDDKPGGVGATFEGAIITQSLMNDKLRNDKFFPILPDDGHHRNIPVILQAYHNGHTFPNGNEGILKLILNDNPRHEPASFSKAMTEANENIKFESKIVETIAEIQGSIMTNPIQILVRSYLSLSEIEKVLAAKQVGAYKEELSRVSIHQRDTEILKYVSQNHLLAAFWDALNLIKPFDNNQNPFQ